MPKFSVCVGNPPYQEYMGTSMTTKKLYIPISNIANKISDITLLIIPFYAFAQRHKKEMKQFSEKVFNYGLKELQILSEEKTTEHFNVLVRGGTCIYLKENGYVGKTNVCFNENENYSINLKENPDFLRYKENEIIMNKIHKKKLKPLTNIYCQEFIGTSSKYFKNIKNSENDLLCYVSKNKFKPGTCYVDSTIIDKKKQMKCWKFITLYVASGIDDYKIAKPNEIYSHSYSGLLFETEKQLKNYLQYRNSFLYRFIYMNEKPSFHLNTGNFYDKFPLIDFSHSWTDQELYEYFNLTQEEIDYIETQLK
jgi:site-specific DNA-methyltransferase (adenine-specific)